MANTVPVIAAGVAFAGVVALASMASASSTPQPTPAPKPKPTPKPKPAADLRPVNPNTGKPSNVSAPEAAKLLYLLVTQNTEGLNWGSKAKPNTAIRGCQNDMGGLTADGIYGPATAARGQALIGKPFPPRGGFPAGSQQAIPANQITVQESAEQMVQALQGGGQTHTIAKPAASDFGTTPAPAPKPAPKPAPAPSFSVPPLIATARAADAPAAPLVKPGNVTTPAAPRGARAAAQALLTYAQKAYSEGRPQDLGTLANPSETVRSCQRDMGGNPPLKTDGVYGPKTRARGKELLGLEFPDGKRVVSKQLAAAPAAPKPTAAPASSAPKDAAQRLFDYLWKAWLADGSIDYAAFGTAASPSAQVASAQRAMGGGLVADGIYGPKTAARGTALLGKAFPDRPKAPAKK